MTPLEGFNRSTHYRHLSFNPGRASAGRVEFSVAFLTFPAQTHACNCAAHRRLNPAVPKHLQVDSHPALKVAPAELLSGG